MNGTYEEGADESRDPRTARTLSPFGKAAPLATAGTEIEKSRATSETEAAIFLARQFPRDQIRSTDKILMAFQRLGLAQQAQYQYARGGTDIVGPSIRAAEAIAQNWGNLQTGFRELERRPGESSVEAFAWDMESNWRETRTFVVEHRRHTRSGSKALEDPRDIYELIANESSRRKRACILAVIPGDIVAAAMAQAQQTLKTSVKITPELLTSIIEKFAAHGVTKVQLELRIQRRFDAITPAQVVNLGNVLNSLNDGMSAPIDWFEVPTATPPPGGAATRAEQLRQRTGVEPAPEAAPTPPAAAADNGPSASEMLDAKVAEFVDAAQGMTAADVLAMVKRQAAVRGIADDRELAELYKRASGKAVFSKTALPAIMRAILEIPIPVVEAPVTTGFEESVATEPRCDCGPAERNWGDGTHCSHCAKRIDRTVGMDGQPNLLDEPE